MQKYIRNQRGERFKYFKTKKKLRLYEARNFALKKIKGKYISFWILMIGDNEYLSSRGNFSYHLKNMIFFLIVTIILKTQINLRYFIMERSYQFILKFIEILFCQIELNCLKKEN